MSDARLAAALRRRLEDTAAGPSRLLGDAALAEMRALAALVGPDDLDSMLLIAVAHWLRYLELPDGDDEPDLAAAVDWFGRIFPYAPERVPRELHAGLASRLPPAGDDSEAWSAEAARYLIGRVTSTPEVLERAIELLEAAVARAADERAVVVYLVNLCSALQTRYQQGGARADVAAAVAAGQRAVRLAGAGDERRGAALGNLGNALRIWYEVTGALESLTMAIDRGREAVEAAEPDDPRLAAYRSSLGTALSTRADRNGDRADLDEAVALGELAVAATSPTDPSRPGRLSNLATALRGRHEREGTAADLDRAIALGEDAVACAATGDPDGAGYRSNLAVALRDRFDRAGAGEDLDRGISLTRAAVAATPGAHPKRPGYLTNLGNMLRNRADLTGSAADLAAAVTTAQEAVQTAAADDPNRPTALSALAQALASRFERDGDLGDLHRAVATAEQSVGLGPGHGPDHARCLNDLCYLRRLRFERLGAAADLDGAVQAGLAAVTATGERRVAAAGYLANLANALHGRFERSGSGTDLDQAIVFARQAVGAARPGSPDRVRYLTNLCGFLIDRHSRTRQPADLAEAVGCGRQAVAARPAHGLEGAVTLSNLSTALVSWSEYSDAAPDLREAAELARQALAAAPQGHPPRGRYASNLGGVLVRLHERTHDDDLLPEALAACSEAVAATPPDSIYRAGRLGNLGQVLALLHEQSHDPDVLRRALAAFRAGAQIDVAPTLVRARLARAEGRLAGRSSNWPDADRAWSAAADLLPLLIDRNLARIDRQQHLSVLAGLGPEAAAVRLRRGDTDGAWAALESGRGILLNQALEGRSDVAVLRERLPRRYDEFVALRSILNADEEPDVAPSRSAAEADRRVTVRRAAVADWSRLLEAIRQVEGLERFGLPPDLAQLRAAAGDDVIVALNVTEVGSDALFLTADGADAMTLPGVTFREAVANADTFLADGSGAAAFVGNEARGRVLGWLWDALAEPVLRRLGHITTPPPGTRWPRVWWIPTGPLSVLPIHAAGHHRDGATSRRAVLDRVVSSYTPTARTLLHARRQPSAPGGRALAVGVSTAAGLPPLRRSAEEARLVARFLGDSVAVLVDGDATTGAVAAALGGAARVHFACHAVTDGDDPSAGYLGLHDGPLTVRELGAATTEAGHAGRAGHLAYLSACTTAFGGTELLDESVHIASALLLSGFAHVIGTLWPVSDRMSPEVAARFYRFLTRGHPPSLALHLTVRELRDRYPENPSLWAAQVHLGA